MSEPAENTLTFEEAVAQLEAIVREMENGKLPLDKLISCYEKGSQLATLCRGQLDKLEQKIEILTAGNDRENKWSDFTPGSGRN